MSVREMKEPTRAPSETGSPVGGESVGLHKPVFAGFLALLAVSSVRVFLRIEPPNAASWPEALVLLGTAATLLVGLARRLPLQNVLMSAFLIGAISGTVTLVSAKTGIPFGPHVYSESTGWILPGGLPWFQPWIWIAAIVGSRGVARLIVRPWRKTNAYGYRVIGLTILLALILALELEPFATQTRRFWHWQTSRSIPNWYGTPWTNFLGWSVTALGILVLTTPWLINKQPVKQPTDYHPLIVWVLVVFYLTASNAIHGYGLAAAAGLAACLLAATFAVRGGRW